MEPIFHATTLADSPVLIGFMADFYAALGLPFSAQNTAAMEALLNNPDLGHAYLIESAAEPSGYFVLTWSFSLERGGKIALLDELFVKPAHRNRGLATAAIHFAAATARHNHCSQMLLEVDHANPAAHSLYQREGFVTLERHYLAKVLI